MWKVVCADNEIEVSSEFVEDAETFKNLKNDLDITDCILFCPSLNSVVLLSLYSLYSKCKENSLNISEFLKNPFAFILPDWFTETLCSIPFSDSENSLENLMNACNFLNLGFLLLLLQKYAGSKYLEGKSVEELRKLIKADNDFSEIEEEQIKKELGII